MRYVSESARAYTLRCTGTQHTKIMMKISSWQYKQLNLIFKRKLSIQAISLENFNKITEYVAGAFTLLSHRKISIAVE